MAASGMDQLEGRCDDAGMDAPGGLRSNVEMISSRLRPDLR